MIKARRHNANNRHCLHIQLQSAPYDVWITPKTSLPKAVAQDNDVVGARLEFFGAEDTTSLRRNTQCRKEAVVGPGLEFWGAKTTPSLGPNTRCGKEVSGPRHTEEAFSHMTLLHQ